MPSKFWVVIDLKSYDIERDENKVYVLEVSLGPLG